MSFVNTYCVFIWLVNYASTQDQKTTYEGAQLWHVEMQGLGEIVVVKKLIDKQEVSAWNLSPQQADILVTAKHRKSVHRHLKVHNLNYSVLIEDVQQSLQAQMDEPTLWDENTLRIGHRLNWKSYPPLHIIEEYYNFLAEEYSSLCKVQTIGYTAQNGTIKMINITNGNPRNNVIVLVAGLHGREWISITSALYILNRIVKKFDKQSNFMKTINWLIIPVANPDGFSFTRTHNRLWRKNRRKFINCKGADVNRNFAIDWGVAGITENNECEDAYSGPYPFSEMEAIAIRDVILKMQKKPAALVDLHSYGSMILYPWSARSQPTKHINMHAFTAQGMAKAIMDTTGQNYSHGPTYHKIYPATGALIDWAYSQGIVHSYAIELRDGGRWGFLLPSQQIEDTGKGVFAAIEFLAKSVDPPKQRRDTHDSWF